MIHQEPKRNHLKWILPILILVLAALASMMMIRSRKMPEKETQINPGVPVTVMTIERGPRHVLIPATGTVDPERQISLVSEVSGKLAWLSPRFVEGGFFRKGEKLLEIDPRDYQLALQRAQAELAKARIGLQTEEEQGAIARREWERIDLQDKGEPGPLVLRQPQLQGEKANLAAAKAAVGQARLNLEKTSIYAPFNGRLSSKKVDLGEFVRSGNPLGLFTSSDRAEILVPLPLEDLRWIDVPPAGSDRTGSVCRIESEIGGQIYSWTGSVRRNFGEIDPTTRMASIVIGVDDPYQLAGAEQGGLPLAHGLFVQLKIEGRRFEDLVAIPRSALHEGNQVWLAGREDLLEIREVKVLRRQQEEVLLAAGLNAGERLVLTEIAGAAPGMKLRPQPAEAAR